MTRGRLPPVRPPPGQNGGIVGRGAQQAQDTESTGVLRKEELGVRMDGPMVKELTRPETQLRRVAAPDTAWPFFNGTLVPMNDAKVTLLPHASHYCTALFHG